MNKKGQLKLSFGMMFSIMLIIIFIIFAIYGIQKFLSFQKELKYQSFAEDLQHDIDQIWKSSYGSKLVNYNLPTEVKSICFVANDTFENLIYKPSFLHEGIIINHLNLAEILKNPKSFCIEGDKGHFSFIIKKNWGEPLITISKS